MATKRQKLTTKQRKFANSYIKTGNATQSAIEAGYSEKYANTNASKLLQNTTINAYIEKQLEKIEDESIMTAKEALELLSKIAKGEETEEVVLATPVGIQVVDKKPDFKTRISAMKEIVRRAPGDDRVSKAQLRKLEAEADIAEMKNRMLAKNEESGNEKLTVLLDL